MFALLEFLFQGFFEWVYSLILDIWNYFSTLLLNVMSLDFAYIKTHIPVVADISQALLAVGWALLLGNLVFQALRSMASGLGFEGEDTKLLFARTFVFGFLLLASPQICETILSITSSVIAVIEIPDAINVHLVDSSVFGVLGASWILVIIFDVITMFMVFSLLLEVAERYMVLAMLTVMAPLAFAMGGSKSTSEIFTGWCRMFGSMCSLMATNIVFFKMLLSVVSTVPSFPDVFLWMVLIVSIVKVAKKADEIITRIGLNPAITGNCSTLPGMLAYTVFRTALSMATKGAANGIGGALGLAGKGAKNLAGLGTQAAGAAFQGAGGAVGIAGSTVGGIGGAVAGGIGGAAAGAAGQRGDRPRYGGGRQQTQQTSTQQEHTWQGQQTQHQTTSRTQTSSQQQTASQERTGRSHTMGPQGTIRTDLSTRKSSVAHGTQRAPSYIMPPSGQTATEEKSSSRNSSSGNTVKGGGFTGTAPSRGGSFGTGSRSGGGFSGGSRGGGFTKDAARGGGFSGSGRGGSFSKDTARGSGFGGGSRSGDFGGAGTKKDAPRGGGTFGGRLSGTPRGAGFGGTFSKTSQETKVTQSGTAETGGSPAARMSSPGASGSKLGTAGTQARSTCRPAAAEPRHSRNGSPAAFALTLGVQRSGPVQQEARQAGKKDKSSVKGGAPSPHPGTAGTGTGPRIPPGQKLSGGPTSQNPTRQTRQGGGPTYV